MCSAALKRLGADDKGERAKELEERKKTEDLSEVIVELQTEILKLSSRLATETDLVSSYLTKITLWEEREALRLAESKAAADEEDQLKVKLEAQITSLQEEIVNSRFSSIDQGRGCVHEADKTQNKPVVSAQTTAIVLRGREKTEGTHIQAVVDSATHPDPVPHGDEGDALSQIPWEDVERDEVDGTGPRTGTGTRGTWKVDRNEGTSSGAGSKLVLLGTASLQ